MLKDARRDMRQELEQVDSLENLVSLFVSYQIVKDKQYNGSWAKRGLVGFVDGAYGRQVDRLEPLLDKILSGEASLGDVDCAFDTLLDVGLYSLMGIRLLAVYFPERFDAVFLQGLHKYIKESITREQSS